MNTRTEKAGDQHMGVFSVLVYHLRRMLGLFYDLNCGTRRCHANGSKETDASPGPCHHRKWWAGP